MRWEMIRSSLELELHETKLGEQRFSQIKISDTD